MTKQSAMQRRPRQLIYKRGVSDKQSTSSFARKIEICLLQAFAGSWTTTRQHLENDSVVTFVLRPVEIEEDQSGSTRLMNESEIKKMAVAAVEQCGGFADVAIDKPTRTMFVSAVECSLLGRVVRQGCEKCRDSTMTVVLTIFMWYLGWMILDDLIITFHAWRAVLP